MAGTAPGTCIDRTRQAQSLEQVQEQEQCWGERAVSLEAVVEHRQVFEHWGKLAQVRSPCELIAVQKKVQRDRG